MTGIRLSDAHLHLDRFPPEAQPEVVSRAVEAGVELMVAAGVHLESSRAVIALASAHPQVYAGVGIHPTRVREPVNEATYQQLASLARSSPKVVAISETGLDFGEGTASPQVQEQAFRQHIRLALELGLPIILHDRQGLAHHQVMRVLREESAHQVGGATHYFQGTWEMAQDYLQLGFYISFGRVVTRDEGALLHPVVQRLPLNRILTETDCVPRPDQTPATWTEPRHVLAVAERIAELRGISLAEAAAAATDNLRRLLRL